METGANRSPSSPRSIDLARACSEVPEAGSPKELREVLQGGLQHVPPMQRSPQRPQRPAPRADDGGA